jgi:hypothetical protein
MPKSAQLDLTSTDGMTDAYEPTDTDPAGDGTHDLKDEDQAKKRRHAHVEPGSLLDLLCRLDQMT